MKKEKELKFKLKAGRLRSKDLCYNVIRDGNAEVYNLLKEKISLDELSELIYLFFEEMASCVVEEKLGVELPCSIGYIQVTGIKETAYKTGVVPMKLNKAVINPNYQTNGLVFRSWYRFTNTDNIVKSKVGMFLNAFLYKFKSCVNLKKHISNKIKAGEWKHWATVNGSRDLFKKNN